MKNLIILFFSFFVSLFSYAQKDSASLVKEIQEFRENLNKEYKDSTESPLSKEEREAFKQINFFPVNPAMCCSRKVCKNTKMKKFLLCLHQEK